jgi:hypothetical protein
MLEGMRGYLQAAGGLTELTRKRAQELAQAVMLSTGSGSAAAMTAQVSSVAEELLGAVIANRAAVREIARAEVEAAVGRLGLVPVGELSAAEQTISRLQARVAELEGQSGRPRSAAGAAGRSATTGRPARAPVRRPAAGSTAPGTGTTSAKKATAKKATAKKATAKKATAKKATAKKATAKKSTAKKATAKKATAKKATAKKATAKKATAKKATAKKTTAKKTTAKKTTAKKTTAKKTAGAAS